MDCKKAEKLLVDYLYRELSAGKTVEVEKHLQTCPLCSKTLESWQAIHAGYQKSAAEPQASPFLKQRLLLAAREELSRSPSFAQRFLAAFRPAVAVPVLLLGLLAILYFQFGTETKMAQAPEVPVKPASKSELIRQRDGGRSQVSPGQMGNEEDQLKSLGYVARGDAAVSQTESLAKMRPSVPLVQEQKALRDDRDEERESRLLQENVPTAAPSSAQPSLETPKDAKPEALPMAAEAPYRSDAAKEKVGFDYSVVRKSGLAGTIFNTAQMNFKQDKLKDGWNYAQQAIQQDRAKSLAPEFHQSGIEYQNNRDYDKAILQFQLIAANYADYSDLEDVLLRLAASHAEIGQFEEAQKVYAQLLQLFPRNRIASEKYKELQKKQEAQKHLQSLESEQPR